MRWTSLIIVFLGLGCQSFPVRDIRPTGDLAQLPLPQTLQQLGQTTIKQSSDLAAQGQGPAACAVLEQFLQKYPDQCEARLEYAELLLRMGQRDQARRQFEDLLEVGQERIPVEPRYLLACHARLAELAAGMKDEYSDHLHKGIGMYLLAQNYKGVAVGETTFNNESLLCKALTELQAAQDLRPEEARPCWYLHLVYRGLPGAQTDAAQRQLRLAQQLAPLSYLTRHERRGLELAGRATADRMRQ